MKKRTAITTGVLWLLLLLAVSTPASSPSTSLVPHAWASQNSWTTKEPMHVARGYLGVAVVNGKIYAIGGNTQSGEWPNYRGGAIGTNEEYDPETDTWVFKKSMPTPRFFFSTAVCQNKIYCIGGYLSNGTVTGVNEVYDPETDTWETKASMPTARCGLQANVVNGKIHLISGKVNHVYDPETDSWTTKEPIPNAASGYASAVVDGKIYVIGGLSKSKDSTLTQIYDPETDTWSQGTPLPSITYYGAAGATTGVNAPKRIYVLSPDYSFSEPPYINGVYDPESDSWTFGASIPTERDGFGVAVVNDMLYVIGGMTETYTEPLNWYSSLLTKYATNEQYTPFGYGTVPPAVHVVSPENKTYTVNKVSLTFNVSKPTTWMGYSLDGQANVNITGNTTLTELSEGSHNLTVYATDTFGNTGTSETIHFSIKSEPFPITLIVAAIVIIAIVGAVLLIYFVKIKKTNEKAK